MQLPVNAASFGGDFTVTVFFFSFPLFLLVSMHLRPSGLSSVTEEQHSRYAFKKSLGLGLPLSLLGLCVRVRYPLERLER